MACGKSFFAVTHCISNAFGRYGYLVGRYPVWFVVVPLVICCGLGVGFLFRNGEQDIELLYTPINSRSRSDREKVKALFPDGTAKYYNPISLNDHGLGGVVLFRPKNGSTVLTRRALQEIKDFVAEVKNVTFNNTEGKVVTYDEVCGRLDGKCEVWGRLVLTDDFWDAYQTGALTFPFWDSPWGVVDLSVWLGSVNKTQQERVQDAGAVKVTFTLRQDSEASKKLSLNWERAFIEFMEQLGDDRFDSLVYAFSSSHSMGEELDRGTKGDIKYFSLTFTIMITYASIVSSGGDCVSTRALLSNAGVVAATMGILASFGLFSFIGVQFVNIVGVVPFLVLGIGVDDMFLLMSCWSSTLGTPDLSIPQRIGATFRAAGIGITITSLTDSLAFAIGASSVFLSVRNFCLYSGLAVLFCYLCNATFFGGCLALHGRRVYSGRHTLTCQRIRPRKDMSEEGRACCTICMCGGATPDKEFADESIFEKGPRVLLPKLVLWGPAKIAILLLFAGYLGVSIWGIMEKLEQGLRLKDLVLHTSYFHRFNTWDEDDFGVAIPVAFAVTQPLNYTDSETLMQLVDLMNKARTDPDVSPLGTYCWFTDYLFSLHSNTSSPEAFATSLRTGFLPNNLRYMNDVVFDASNQTVVASRCHVMSENLRDSTRQAQLMLRMREVADGASLPVLAYHPAFVYFEQYVMIMSSTLQTVGITLAVMFVATFVFLVHPTIVLLVFVNIVMIVVGIFGFMGIWGLTLSSVTMIHLIMSVGFSVDFSAHVCSAFMLARGRTRQERAHYALVHASGPVFNSGFSSLIGIVVLVFSDSYIFQSFFKIMLLVIAFGIVHAVLLIPVLLSWLGPMVHEDAMFNKVQNGASASSRESGVSSVSYKQAEPVPAGDKVMGDKPEIDLFNGDGKTKSPIYDTLGYVVEYDNPAYTHL